MLFSPHSVLIIVQQMYPYSPQAYTITRSPEQCCISAGTENHLNTYRSYRRQKKYFYAQLTNLYVNSGKEILQLGGQLRVLNVKVGENLFYDGLRLVQSIHQLRFDIVIAIIIHSDKKKVN